MVEPILGEGGFVVPAPGFLATLAAWGCRPGRRAGGRRGADRVRAHRRDVRAMEHEGVVPDLVAWPRASPAGCPSGRSRGAPSCSTRCTPAAWAARSAATPACAAALASLEIYERDDLAGAARAIEAAVLPGSAPCVPRCPPSRTCVVGARCWRSSWCGPAPSSPTRPPPSAWPRRARRRACWCSRAAPGGRPAAPAAAGHRPRPAGRGPDRPRGRAPDPLGRWRSSMPHRGRSPRASAPRAAPGKGTASKRLGRGHRSRSTCPRPGARARRRGSPRSATRRTARRTPPSTSVVDQVVQVHLARVAVRAGARHQ